MPLSFFCSSGRESGQKKNPGHLGPGSDFAIRFSDQGMEEGILVGIG